LIILLICAVLKLRAEDTADFQWDAMPASQQRMAPLSMLVAWLDYRILLFNKSMGLIKLQSPDGIETELQIDAADLVYHQGKTYITLNRAKEVFRIDMVPQAGEKVLLRHPSAAAALLVTEYGVSYLNPTDNAEMVFIPKGEFVRGSNAYDPDEKQKKIWLDGYWIYRYEVTVGQFRQYCTAKGKTMPPQPAGENDNFPVVNITWQDAKDYAEWAHTVLPTEAQWEKAARGSKSNIYPWGNNWAKDQGAFAVDVNTGAGLMPVDSNAQWASDYGVVNTIGNAREWCEDYYDQKYYDQDEWKDPQGPKEGMNKVVRGTVMNPAQPYRCSYRYSLPVQAEDFSTGFRCVQRVRLASLQVTTDPDDLQITVNGKRYPDLSRPLPLPPGTVEIEARRGGQAETKQTKIEPGKQLAMRFAWRRITLQLDRAVDEVKVNDEIVANTKKPIMVPPGSVTIQAHARSRDWQPSFDCNPRDGEVVRVPVETPPIEAGDKLEAGDKPKPSIPQGQYSISVKSPDGQTLPDAFIRIDGQPYDPAQPTFYHIGETHNISASKDGFWSLGPVACELKAAVTDLTIILQPKKPVDPPDGPEPPRSPLFPRFLEKVDLADSKLTSLAISGDGQSLAVGTTAKAVVYSLSLNGNQPTSLTEPVMQVDVDGNQYVTAVALSPAGTEIAVGEKLGSVLPSYKLYTRRIEADAKPDVREKSEITAIAYAPDGQAVAWALKSKAVKMQPAVGKVIEFTADGAMQSLAISPDNRTLTGVSKSGTVNCWELATGVETTMTRQGKLLAASFLEVNGELYRCQLDDSGIIRWFERASFEPLTKYSYQLQECRTITEAAFSANGRFLVVYSEGACYFYEFGQ